MGLACLGDPVVKKADEVPVWGPRWGRLMVCRPSYRLIGHPPMVEGSPKEINKGDVAE